MSGGGGQRVKVRRTNRYSVVHDSVLEAKNLSFASRIVLAWALGRQDGFECWIWYMNEQLGLSDKQWKSARIQLTEAGFFKQDKARGERGVFIWTNEFTDAPLSDLPPADKKQRSTKPAKPAAPITSQGAEEQGMDDPLAEIQVDKTNKKDVENAKKIACWPPGSIGDAVRSAKSAAPNGVAYPTAVLRLLMSSGVTPSPQQVQLAEWAAQAERQKKQLPAGMKTGGGT